jgi:ketosteroid isomerase-like protein
VAIVMAEHPHAALVRKGYAAFSRGDMDTLRGIMTSDCAQHVPGSSQISGDFKGVDNILAYYQQLFELTGGAMRAELRDVFVDGRGHAMSVHHLHAERGGKSYDAEGGIVFRIVGDKATDLDECIDDIGRSDAFWG